jgi:DNA-binding PadR family transcriptional regulator
MTLKHVLLGFLSYGPKTGYSLHKSIYEPLRPSLPEIYRALNKMLDEKLLTSKRVAQEKLPAQNVCQITEKGLLELQNAFKQAQDSRLTGENLLSLLWFGTRVDQKDISNLLRQFRNKKGEELEYYRKQANKVAQRGREHITSLDRVYWELCTSLVIKQCDMEARWAKDAIRQIDTLAPKYDDRGSLRGKLQQDKANMATRIYAAEKTQRRKRHNK